jgi:outer membrane protein TolC
MPPLTVSPTARLGFVATQPPETSAPAAATPRPGVYHLTLDQAKHQALTNSKLLNMGILNAHVNEYAVKAARADYFPKVMGSVFYFHFNDTLGTVLTGGGRTVTGPLGRAMLTIPSTTANVPVLTRTSVTWASWARTPSSIGASAAIWCASARTWSAWRH